MSAPFQVHATAVVLAEAGLLIRGPSGSGKSRLAAQLLDAGRREGRFARLVGDDRVTLQAVNGRVIVTALPVIAGLIEERGTGLLSVPYERCALVRAVVDLASPEAQEPRLPEAAQRRCTLVGVALPRLVLDHRLSDLEKTRRTLTFMSRVTVDSESL